MFATREKESLEDTEYITRVLENLEFDGTQVLCRVCGDKASGFHYGVHSCEGCKGFFRRSIQQKIQYRPCTKNQQCSIQRVNRNRCQYCRLKKCIAVGMSRDAVRFGRVPKREKARIIAAMQNVQSRTLEKSLLSELDEEVTAVNDIVQAYLDTCEYTSENISQLRSKALSKPMYIHDSQSTCCPLFPTTSSTVPNQSSFSIRFSKAIRGVINFALRLPGFNQIPTEDRFLLLKSGAFEALLVSLAGLYESESNTFLCMNGQLMRREIVYHPSNSRFLMDSVCDFAERLNRLNLSDVELALFIAVVLISPDRHGIRHKDLIERFYDRLTVFLQNALLNNHSGCPNIYRELISFIPDLRTLNALHSDKSFCQRKMEQTSLTFDEGDYSNGEIETNSCYSPPCGGLLGEERRSPFVESFGSESPCTLNQSMYDNNITSVINNLPKTLRHREPSEGGSSSDDNLELICKYSLSKRKVDNPDDSGIESDKVSLPSICSSPRSSIDEKAEDERGGEDDMPVLRRALQAPPIMNTDWIMEEAYNKPHKKFRAFRREEPRNFLFSCSTSPSALPQQQIPSSNNTPQRSSSSILASVLTSPSLAKTLSEKPKMSENALKRADILHTLIVKNEEDCECNQTTDQANATAVHSSSLELTSNRLYSSLQHNNNCPFSTKESLNGDRALLFQRLTYPASEVRGADSRHLTSSFPRNINCSSGVSSHSCMESASLDRLQSTSLDAQQPLNLSKKTPPSSPSLLRIKV